MDESATSTVPVSPTGDQTFCVVVFVVKIIPSADRITASLAAKRFLIDGLLVFLQDWISRSLRPWYLRSGSRQPKEALRKTRHGDVLDLYLTSYFCSIHFPRIPLVQNSLMDPSCLGVFFPTVAIIASRCFFESSSFGCPRRLSRKASAPCFKYAARIADIRVLLKRVI